MHGADGPVNDPVSIDNESGLTDRQQWVLRQMRADKQMHIGDIADEFECSKTTAKRDLTELRSFGLVEFISPPKTGHWRLVT